MKLFDERNNKTLNIEFEGVALKLLNKLKINPEEVLIVRNNELVTTDEKLKNSDDIKLLSVISGG